MLQDARCWFVLCAALMAACSPSGEAGGQTPPSTSRAERIIPASASATDFLVALVEPERLVAIPEQSLEYSVLHELPEEYALHPRFSAYAAEQILAHAPDLVVIDRWQDRGTSARLREAGVKVLELQEIASYPEARSALIALGEALGASERARAAAAALDERVRTLEEESGPRSGLRALSYSNFGAQGWTSGAQTSIDAMLRLAGMRNAAERREGTVRISFEELLVLDPDVIVVSEPLKLPAGHAGDRGGASGELLLAESALRELRAVRDRHIVALPAWLFATGSSEIVTGAEELARRVDAMLGKSREEKE